jgi:carbon storage regulator
MMSSFKIKVTPRTTRGRVAKPPNARTAAGGDEREFKMLVLTRKANESIKAGNIEIKVLRVRGNKVVLGIAAPNELKILRTELEGDDESCAKSA